MCRVYLYWMNVIGWNCWFLFSLLLRAYICMLYSSLTLKCTIFFVLFSINYAPIFTTKLIKKFSTPIFISLSPFSPCACLLFLNSISLYYNFIISLEYEMLSTINVYYYLLFMVNLCDKIVTKELMEYQLSS